MSTQHEEYMKDFNMNVATHGNRQTTHVSFLIQVIAGLLGTALTCVAVLPFKGTYIYGVVLERGPVQFVELFMAFMVAAFIIMKFKVLNSQGKIIKKGPVDYDVDLANDAQVQDLRDRVMYDDHFGKSIVLDQVNHMLTLWLASKDTGRVSDWFNKESETSMASSDTTYAHIRVLLWAIPIMGFIGTVMGLGGAVSGFSDFLSGAAELSAIKDAIGNVTVGLGVAFDTTLLALVLSVMLMFPLTFAQRMEGLFFVEMENYLQDSLLSRFPAEEQQTIRIANLEDAIETGFRRYIPDPDRYDEVFSRSIEKAGVEVEKRFADLARSYEGTISELDNHLSQTVAKSSETVEGSIRELVSALQRQETEMLADRREIAKQQVEQFKELTAEMAKSAEGLVGDYHKTAEALHTATVENSCKSLAAAEQLAERLGDVAKLSAELQRVMDVQGVIEKGLSGIHQAEDFGQLIRSMREHLDSTDAFCKQLSRPRVITLKEEPIQG